MATQKDVRRIALSLPDTSEVDGRFAFVVRNKNKDKQFVWAWNERVHPKKPRVPNPTVLAVRVPGRAEKRALLASDAEKFFTEPHYDGFPAVLVRLPAVGVRELRALIEGAWRCQAPAEGTKKERTTKDRTTKDRTTKDRTTKDRTTKRGA